MASFWDSVYFVATSTGTGSFVVSGAVTGYMTPANAGVSASATVKYRAESADLSQWEIGEGVYSSGTLTRVTVLYNSSGTGSGAGQSGAGTKISFSTVPNVGIVALKEDLISPDDANVFSSTQLNQIRKNTGQFTGGGYANISAAGSGSTITLTADAVALFDGSGNVYGATSVSLSISTTTTGANALDTGTVATNQYHYFVIYNPSTNTVAGLISLSSTAPTMPSGYTYKRRVGWIYYSGGITTFNQRNANFTWGSPRTVVSGGSGLTSFSLATFCSPTAARIYGYMIANNNNVQVNDNGNNPICVIASITSGQCFYQWSFTPINTTYLIYYSSSSGGGSAAVTGWEDSI